MINARIDQKLKLVFRTIQSWDLYSFQYIYINDSLEGLITNVKLFADDTSLFSVP